MLVQERTDPGRRPPTIRRTPGVLLVLALAAIAVWALRHDYWFWDTPHPLLFGFLPVALWWQALVSILAAVLMWLMVRLAWPQELEDQALEAEKRRLQTKSASEPP